MAHKYQTSLDYSIKRVSVFCLYNVIYWAIFKNEIMEAYNVKYGTKVIVTDENVKTPPSSIPINKGDKITIHRLDGMYCNGLNENGDRIYIAGWTEVKPCA